MTSLRAGLLVLLGYRGQRWRSRNREQVRRFSVAFFVASDRDTLPKQVSLLAGYQMTTIRSRRFTVGRLMQTPVTYIISETLRTVVYEGIFTEIKIIRFSEYDALFPKVPRFTNQDVTVHGFERRKRKESLLRECQMSSLFSANKLLLLDLSLAS